MQRRTDQIWAAGRAGRQATSRARLQARHTDGALRFTTRIDGVRYQRTLVGGGTATEGYGLSGATAVRVRLHRFRFDGLATMYATDGYRARIYAYEPELPQAVSIRPIYGTGVRLVAVAQVEVAVFRLSARWRLQRTADGTRHVISLQCDSTTPGSR
jgi:hypothetical protein